MLLQSHNGVIHLLPTLPKAWSDGHVVGLCARDGFEVDMEWEDGKLVEARIYSKNGGKALIKYKENEKVIETEQGKEYLIEFE